MRGTRGGGRPIRRRLAGLALGGALAAGALAGCTSARSNLGTSDSSCYLALPTASKAVGGHGRLLGVHLFSLSQLHKQAPRLLGQLAAGRSSSEHVCVVAYTGNFTKATVEAPLGRASGHLAVVVADAPSNHLIATVLFSHPPLHFGHPHIG